jgi:hypothetical protein
MSLPIGAISMFDISAAYGRGATGSTGFRNYYPYALGEYYRGGQYVPLYDNSSPNGTRATSQANVDMNTLRGSGGYTHYSNMVAGTNGGKFPAIGYTIGSFGSVNDRTVKCFHPTDPMLVAFYTVAGTFSLQMFPTTSGIYPQNSTWYSVQIINVDGATYNTSLLRTNATSFSQGGPGVGNSVWTWTGVNPFVAGTTYNIRVRLTSTY